MTKNEFTKKIQQNFEEFKQQTLLLSKEKIFEKSTEILFKSFLNEYLQDSIVLDKKLFDLAEGTDISFLDVFYNIFKENELEYFILDLCDEIITDYLELEDNEIEIE